MAEYVTHQALLEAGLSFRRLHYWTARGYLRADNPDPGSGRRTRWAVGEVLVARLMLLLVDECEVSPAKAAEVARAGGMTAHDGMFRVSVRLEAL